MNYTFDNILERDVDFLILDRLYSSQSLLNLFLAEAGLDGYELVDAIHSDMDPLHGESDIVAIVRKGDDIHAIMIENKIGAAAQAKQFERYHIRGKEHYGDAYTVFLIAPQAYLGANYEAQEKYKHKISYETIRDTCFSNDPFAFSVLSRAITKKEKSGSVIISEETTNSWHAYYQFQKATASDLVLQYTERAHGPASDWPHYVIPHGAKGLTIIHKTKFKTFPAGTVELQFNGMADKEGVLRAATKDLLAEDMYWKAAGKSISVAIDVPAIDFSQPFTQYERHMPLVFDAVRKLLVLARKIGNIPHILNL